ncbi:hypothetical protein CDD82_7496 [Ophiocordyceps australis]|uniref:DUF3074 domain-containing protein n=1 Tax=Ophiocordyceps australis TaxID=1399860 RepID=A0A2C5YR87_9HYPO|nr:hypothetical protein CDD82_7496 [Ophiocordyceps australis]
MASHHEPFKALGALDWAEVPQDGLDGFLESIFDDAQTVIDSIPSSSTVPSGSAAKHEQGTGRARAKTDSVVDEALSPTWPKEPSWEAEQLYKEWKAVKMNQKDNGLDIQVYKLSAKDAKGAWFARRSVHEGFHFEGWKRAFESEFAESMKVQGSPGSGNIRGIGADRRVEHYSVEGRGQVDVFQLSAQFPGPTAPRDFITLLLTAQQDVGGWRQYMIVSKPCMHPDCPPRPGIIRGQYESVEVVREVVSDSLGGKRSLSHADLQSSKGSSRRALPRAVEWIMVTRSDPGGSVPRFMIEKGTPPGIVGDAAKFLQWATALDGADSASNDADDGAEHAEGAEGAEHAEQPALPAEPQGTAVAMRTAPMAQGTAADLQQSQQGWGNSGPYSIITGALGAASSVALGLRQQFTMPLGGMDGSQDGLWESQSAAKEGSGPSQTDSDEASASDSDSSTLSFASALEKSQQAHDTASQSNGMETGGASSAANHDPESKQAQKLAQRRRRIDDEFARTRQKLEAKRRGERERDASKHERELAKHERELAKHEAKYRREMRKLDSKREQQQRKAEARQRKDAARQLDHVRAERDEAIAKAHALQLQVDELQAQNTMLAARLGRREDSGPSSSSSSGDAAKAQRQKH